MTAWRPGEAGRAGIAEARRILNAAVPERDFQRSVVDLATLKGYRVFHDMDSRRNVAGVPDLLMVKAPRVLFAELKAERGRLSADQRGWLDELERCTEVHTFVWRPGDWSQIQEVLR